MALISGPFWLFEFTYTTTLIFAAVVLYGAGYLFGGLAGKFIIVKKYPSVLVGLVSGFLIVLSATFVGSLVGFFNEGLPDKSPISDPFEDYIFLSRRGFHSLSQRQACAFRETPTLEVLTFQKRSSSKYEV